MSPILEIRIVSIFIWISSASIKNSTLPSSISFKISPRVLTIKSLSLFSIMPCFPSILAWAILPIMSWRYILWSNLIEELKSSTLLSVDFENLPPHNFITFYLFFYKFTAEKLCRKSKLFILFLFHKSSDLERETEEVDKAFGILMTVKFLAIAKACDSFVIQ